jgi:hypothetical protein
VAWLEGAGGMLAAIDTHGRLAVLRVGEGASPDATGGGGAGPATVNAAGAGGRAAGGVLERLQLIDQVRARLPGGCKG